MATYKIRPYVSYTLTHEDEGVGEYITIEDNTGNKVVFHRDDTLELWETITRLREYLKELDARKERVRKERAICP